MAYAAVDGPPEPETPAALATTSTIPPTAMSPSSQPARKASPLLRARGVISIRMSAMTGMTPMATPAASGRMPPIA
jgi:hypothetical protein